MHLPLGLVVSDEDFLILDDGESDFIKEKTQLEKPTSKPTESKPSSENNSLSNLISRIQGLIGFVVDKVRSIITGSRKIIAKPCLLYTSPSPRDGLLSRMPSSA